MCLVAKKCATLLHGKTYLVRVDRFSIWPLVQKIVEGAKVLIRFLKINLITYCVPEELASGIIVTWY